MSFGIPILAETSVSPILVEKLIFGDDPSFLWHVIYDLAIVAVVFLPLISVIAMISIWAERRVAGRMQSRLGPNRVGPFGLLQSVADGLKLLLKEDLLPDEADGFLFHVAPYLAFAPVFAAYLALAFGPNLTFEPRLNVGVFWLLAILSVEIMGVILAGWASNNKWAIYGAMREACQMVSYEIPLGISIIIGVMTAGTLNLVQLGHLQSGGIHTWIIFRNPFVFAAFFLYFVASLASNKRAPFDLPESESELVAGFHTEYSGLRFSFFFFAEYAAMFVVAGIQTGLFLGGWNDPFGLLGYYYHRFTADPENVNTAGLIAVNLVGCAIFMTKCITIIFVQMWIRWTFPRPRIDQVLYACVKVMLPLACLLLLGATLWQLFVPEISGIPWSNNTNPWIPPQHEIFAWLVQVLLALIGVAGFSAVVGWVAYAFASGRGLKQRLTDPAPIVTEADALVTQT
ncbi:MAG TPA: NADH-quinone oxidoreductase subunit NuoH [Tepidisphaeraceae bacterium]|nr:NADH-quinone oxidoreductase subunit NuoH [Tepidisphaeraceae bacterium]